MANLWFMFSDQCHRRRRKISFMTVFLRSFSTYQKTKFDSEINGLRKLMSKMANFWFLFSDHFRRRCRKSSFMAVFSRSFSTYQKTKFDSEINWLRKLMS